MTPPPLPGDGGSVRRRTAVLLLALVLVPYALSLGHPPLWDANEPLYAEPPREALESGRWLVPTLDGEPWFVHPPLSTWLTIPSYALFGVSEFAERIPMAVAAALTVLAAASIARRVGGPRAGLLAGLVLAATPRFWLFSRQLSGDVVLTACLTGALALALPALDGEPGGRKSLLAGHALAALGMLAKGPVIAVLYAVPLLSAALLSRPRVPLARLRPLDFAVAVAVLGAPWFAYMTATYGGKFVDTYFLHNHLDRMFSDDLGGKSWSFYVVALLGDGLPWVAFLPLAAFRAWSRKERSSASCLAWAGALFPPLLFSLFVGKRNVYLLPMYPFVAAVVAPLLLEVWDGGRRRLAAASSAIGAAAAIAGTVLVGMGRGHVPDDVAAAAIPFLAIGGVGGGALALGAVLGHGRIAVAAGIGTAWAAVLGGALALPILGRYMPVPRLAEALVAEAREGDAAVVYGASIHSLDFYARRPAKIAHNRAELEAAVPLGGRAYVVAHEDSALSAKRDAAVSGFSYREIARGANLRLQFSAVVLGRGPATRDLVLFAYERAPRDGGEAPAKGPR